MSMGYVQYFPKGHDSKYANLGKKEHEKIK